MRESDASINHSAQYLLKTLKQLSILIVLVTTPEQTAAHEHIPAGGFSDYIEEFLEGDTSFGFGFDTSPKFYWHVVRTWELDDNKYRYAATNKRLHIAVADTRRSCKAYLRGLERNTVVCNGPPVLTVVNRIPVGQCTAISITDMGWRSGSKTKFCTNRGYQRHIPAGACASDADYEDGGWCTSENDCDVCSLQTTLNGIDHNLRPTLPSCSTTSAFVAFHDGHSTSLRHTLTGFGTSEELAIESAKKIGQTIGWQSPRFPREVIETSFANDCTTCVQVDMKRGLHWHRSHKTEFCKANGFEGVHNYSGHDYKDGGACYIGPGCSDLGFWQNGLGFP